MYLRSTPRRNKDGSEVRYLQLARNVWDPQKRRSAVQVVYNFGREDGANREALQRLVSSVSRFLDPDAALAAAAGGLEFTESRPLGGTWVLDALWSRLGAGTEIRRLLKERRGDETAERVLFALVANRALAPSPELAASRWVNEDVLVAGLPVTSDAACYRAMDWLTEIKDELQRRVCGNLATVLNPEAGLLFFDMTCAYFVAEREDGPLPRDDHGMPLASGNTGSKEDGKREPGGSGTWGKSQDHHGDLPQMVIGMAVSRDGIPVRVWCWPGATAGPALIRQVKDDMRDWCRSKVIWVADRGSASAADRRRLRKGGGSYIIGEKLRSGSAEAAAALSRQGGYKDVAGNLKVREVPIAGDERFVICYCPQAAERDAAARARTIARLEEIISDSDRVSRDKRAELRGVISAQPGLDRYLRLTPGGLLRIDAARAKAEENLDGKYLLRTADPELSAADMALGYRQLLEVRRGWRDMNQVTDLRPLCQRREDRIRAHAILCWLALLLTRIAENAAGQTWPDLRRELTRIHIGTFTGPAGTFRQRTELTKPQRDILRALETDAPPRIYQLKLPVDA